MLGRWSFIHCGAGRVGSGQREHAGHMSATRPDRHRLAVFGGAAITLVTIVQVVASFLDLFEKFPWFLVTLVTLNLAMLLTVGGVLWKTSEPTDGEITVGLPRRDTERRGGAIWRSADPHGCQEIDIMGLVLRSEMFQRDSDFSRWLLKCLRSNPHVRVRIMLLDPDQRDLVRLRERAERGVDSPGFLAASCNESLEVLRELVTTIWKEQQQRRPQVALVTEVPLYQWMFRIDQQMAVSPYLQHRTGAASPVFRFERARSPWFDVYQEQFERCFRMHQHNLFPPQEELLLLPGRGAQS